MKSLAILFLFIGSLYGDSKYDYSKFLDMPRESALNSEEFKLLVAEQYSDKLNQPNTPLTLKMLMEYELDSLLDQDKKNTNFH